MNKKFIKQLKLKNICPFYIDNINDKFFANIKNNSNRYFVNKILPSIQKNLKDDELIKLSEINNLTKVEKIKLMLNLSLKKIVSKTGSLNNDLFKIVGKDNFEEHLYIDEIKDYGDILIHENNVNNSRYNFAININETSYLIKYIQQIQISFYLDEDNKILSGGISLNYKQIDIEQIDFENAIEEIYLNTLIKYFIKKQLYPMSLNNLLDIVELYEPKKNKKWKINSKQANANKFNERQTLNFKNVKVNDLQQNWIDLINRKYLNFKKLTLEQKKYFEDELLFSILITSIFSLSLYEELKKYFTSDKPELILNLLNKPALIKGDPNQSPEDDFIALSKYLRNTYFQDHGRKNNLKKIKNAEDFFEAINDYSYHDDYSFGYPIQFVEILRNKHNPLILEKSIFDDNHQLKIIYLITIHPELFGMNELVSSFIDWKQLKEIVFNDKLNQKVSESLKDKIKDSICEINYNYVSFLSASDTVLLVKNDTFLFENNQANISEHRTNLFANYFWAEIYSQFRLLIKIDTDYGFTNNKKDDINFYKNKTTLLENIKFNWYDDFYGMSQIKNIVQKINNLYQIQNSIDDLIERMRKTDQLNKKDRERKTIALAYVVATIIGFINFFGMVFTILTITNSTLSSGLTTTNIIIISIGTFLAFILLVILIYFSIKALKQKIFNKKRNK